jgi:patatin-like phospholipase/acyl hydrolase
VSAFNILSLDGGGVRGVATAAFIAAIEKNLGHPLTQHFDLIAGTSTGGIIAAALAMNKSGQEIEHFYQDWGPRIFSPAYSARPSRALGLGYWLLRKLVSEPSLADIQPEWIVSPKYQLGVLSDALCSVFGDTILNEASKRLVIPAVDLIKGQTVVFRTPHLPNMVRDRSLRVASVGLATAAAPMYFHPNSIEQGSLYADGGLWANNPTMLAYTEAIRIARECNRVDDSEFSIDDIAILSVGTGTLPYYVDPCEHAAGIAFWLPRLFDVIGTAQSQAVHFQAGFLLGPAQYCRIDFRLPDKSFGLDCANKLNALAHRGRELAIEQYSIIKERFLVHSAGPYSPFDP